MFAFKFFVWIALGIGIVFACNWYEAGSAAEQRRDVHMRQLEDDDSVPASIRGDYVFRNGIYAGACAGWLLLGGLLFHRELSTVNWSGLDA
jgi:hypothetical protein